MSEDGDPMDQNDNLSEFVGDRTILDTFLLSFSIMIKKNLHLNNALLENNFF